MGPTGRSGVVLVFLLVTLQVDSVEIPPETWMTTVELVTEQGYAIEEHRMVTSDGYVLTHHRIPGTKDGGTFDQRLLPLVLVHGMCTSSGEFVVTGRDRGLGFVAADAGYDVWMINMRFNRYGEHVNMSRSEVDFWDFSLDENGLIDVPESIDYVLKTTGARKVHYVGYSLGAMTYVAMCDSRPDLAARVASFSAMAPSIYLTNVKSLAELMYRWGVFDVFRKMGVKMLHLNNGVRQFLTKNCKARKRSEDVCWAFVFSLVGENYEQLDWRQTPLIINRIPPASSRQLEQIAQLAVNGEFSKYDFGPEGNTKRYGTPKPPNYDLSKSKAPAFLYYGQNDNLLSYKDLLRIRDAMKSGGVSVELIESGRGYNHLTFVWGKNVAKDVYRQLLKNIDRISEHRKS